MKRTRNEYATLAVLIPGTASKIKTGATLDSAERETALTALEIAESQCNRLAHVGSKVTTGTTPGAERVRRHRERKKKEKTR